MNLLLIIPTIAVSLVLFFDPAEAFLSPSFTQRRIISLNQSPFGDYMIFNQLTEDSAAQGASSVSSSFPPNKKVTTSEEDELIKKAFESTNPANEGIPPPSANIDESEDVVQEEKKKDHKLKPEERRFDPMGFWTPHSSQF